MPESALGRWLKGLRDDRSLSLRDVSQRGEVDHAYVYRLETGAKESPSVDVITKLIEALTPSSRNVEILRFLASHPSVDVGLADFAREDESVTPEEFHMLTTVVNRGARPDYATSLARIRRFMQEEDDG
ncbi:helix-turn-helix domain-containing protein [Phenylobacterium ferrooxidans]|uniref:Helix-turn-helix domain-containing protein n=1 Tax=Phenylobacterium ferrooxidans TaxID=2982689 RepID=A0ABW6CN62_9CAUL